MGKHNIWQMTLHTMLYHILHLSIFRTHSIWQVMLHTMFYESIMHHTLHFYARMQNASRVFAIVWASVRPSVTLVSCIKTVQARITKFLLWAATMSLVYRDKILCHWVQGLPSNFGVEQGYPLKRRHFAVIGSNNVKTVADRYIHAAYHNKHW